MASPYLWQLGGNAWKLTWGIQDWRLGVYGQNINLDRREFSTKGQLSHILGFSILAKTPGACLSTSLEWSFDA